MIQALRDGEDALAVPGPARDSRRALTRVQRQGPKGKVRRVKVITQVEDLGKSRRRPVIVLPGAVVELIGEQVLDTAADGLGVAVAGRKERDEGPRRLGRRRGPLALGRGVIVGMRQLAPAAV